MTIKRNLFVFLLLFVLAFFQIKKSLIKDLGEYEEYTQYQDPEDEDPLILSCQDIFIKLDVNCQATLVLTNAAFLRDTCANIEKIMWICEVDLWADGTVDYVAATNYTHNNWTFDDDPWYGLIQKIHIDATASMDSEDQVMDQLSKDQIVTVALPDTIAVRFSNHKVTWKAIDGCENEAGCQMNISVGDNKSPTPNCVKTSSAILIDGSVELWAIDFNINSFDNCTAQDDLYFTFNEMRGPLKDTIIRVSNTNYVVNSDMPYFFSERGFLGFNGDGELADVNGNIIPVASTGNINKYKHGDIQKWVPEINSSSRIFDYDDCLAQGPQGLPVRLSVWDKIGNTEECEVLISLIDNQNGCWENFPLSISGNVSNEQNQLLEGVEITLESEINDLIITQKSNNGSFLFYYLTHSRDYTISCSNDIDYMNGISTLDLILIQRHIFQIQELPTAYRLVAADVNDDLNISTDDVVDLRKMILGITNEFIAPSWRFLDANEPVFMEIPLEFSSSVFIPNLQEDYSGANFIAIKMGDVSGDAKANFSPPYPDSSSHFDLILDIDEASYLAGESFTVDITSSNFENVFGMQFSASIEGLKFDGIIEGSINIDESSIGLPTAQTLTFSWAANEATTKSKDDVLFTLRFTTEKNITLGQVIEIHSKVTKSESYIGSDMELGAVILNVNGKLDSGGVNVLYQNEPNPFKDYTEISYFLVDEGLAYFRLYNVDGKLLMKKTIQSKKGMNVLGLSNHYLGSAKGIIYYQLESGNFSDTKKMIIME